jgi:AcrR family transcriptional regulator
MTSPTALRAAPTLPADPRYQRLMVATRDAARGGYEAMQMRELAAATRMSLTTVYQFCSSKDHLIAEAHVDWIDGFRSGLARRSPAGATPAERVATVLRQLSRSLDRHRELTLTILRALASTEPAVRAARRSVSDTYAAIIDDAIGDEPVRDRAAVIEILGHVIGSVLGEWASQSIDAGEAGDVLQRAAHLLVRSA